MYYCVVTRTVPIDEGSHVAVLGNGPSSVVKLLPGLAPILHLCQGCRPLEEHARTIQAALPGLTPLQIDAALDWFCEHGLLRRLALHRRPQVDDCGKRDITSVGVITADRPELLRRGIDSIVDHCHRHRRAVRLLIVDGSQSKEARTANRQTCASRRATNCSIAYVGSREIFALNTALVSAGVDPDTARFAFDGGTTGANRNLLLMLTMGEHFMMCDDDVLWQTWTLPEHRSGLAIGGHQDPRVTRFYESRAAAINACQIVDEDLLLAHEAALGLSLDALLSNASDVDIRDACPHLLTPMSHGSDHLVKITMSGVAGDAGIYCPYSRLFGVGPTTQRLLSDDKTCRLGLQSREVVCGVPSVSLSHNPGCQAFCVGIANLGPTVPFLPIGRNTDGVFAALLTCCDPNALLAHVPIGIVHDSDRPSRYEPRIRLGNETRISGLLLAIAATVGRSTMSHNEQTRIRKLAETLNDIASANVRDFQPFMASILLETHAADLRHAEAAERQYSDYRAQAFREYRQQSSRSLKSDRLFVPIEFWDEHSAETSVLAVQRYLRQCATLLTSWGELAAVAHAVELRRTIEETAQAS